MRFLHGDVIIECVQGDIVQQPDLVAVVNAANARLAPGGGVAGAIHRAAGPELYEACRPFAPIEVGQAVVTDGYNLPNRYVIHVLGPVYAFEEDPAGKLALAYRSVVNEAERLGIPSLGTPAISTGIFGYPKEEAAEVLTDTLAATLTRCQYLRLVRLVLFTAADVEIHLSRLAVRFDEVPAGGEQPERLGMYDV